MQTNEQYDLIVSKAREIFIKKNMDYGTAWRILRLSSLTDQLYIKASRIRSIEEKGEKKVGDSVDLEYIGIINYCIMALIQLDMKEDDPLELPLEQLQSQYNQKIAETKSLMERKNHDYGEAWRGMRISSITDLILMKILRIRQIEDNGQETIISEGTDANFMDILNYAVFALIKLDEKSGQTETLKP